MRVVIFGASGMVGQGALRQCLLADEVREVVSVVRTPTGVTHPKLREIVHRDFYDFAPIADPLTNLDACFFCLGTSSIGKNEADYARVTYDITVAAGTVLAARSPQLTFVFVSGAGTDSSETRAAMWARVKGRAENAILAMAFKAAYSNSRMRWRRPADTTRRERRWTRARAGPAVRRMTSPSTHRSRSARGISRRPTAC